jgi:hypothetical protein
MAPPLSLPSTNLDGRCRRRADPSLPLYGIAYVARASCVAVDGTGDIIDIAINGSGEATASKDDIDGTQPRRDHMHGFHLRHRGQAGHRIRVGRYSGGSWTKNPLPERISQASRVPPARCVAADVADNVTAFTAPSSEYALSVFVTGEGRVESSPAGIACEIRRMPSHVFEGAVTLTATPKPGYVLAGRLWMQTH